MEIRRSDQPANVFRDLFTNIVEWLEKKVDKSVLASDLTIAEPDDYEFHGKALIEDNRQIKLVESWLTPIANRLHRAHRAVTGKRDELQSYAKSRIEIRDRALAAFRQADEDRRQALADKIAAEQRKEEEQRRNEEAKELTASGNKKAAEQVLARPIVARPISIGRAYSNPKGVSNKVRWRGIVQNDEELIEAVARPAVLRQAAAAMKAKYGKDAAKYVKFLNSIADDAPDIPYSMLSFEQGKINKAVDAVDGKLEWPGVVPDAIDKTQARTR